MADYKKTPKYEESKTPMTVQNLNSRKCFQGKENGLKMSTVQNPKSHSSIYGVES